MFLFWWISSQLNSTDRPRRWLQDLLNQACFLPSQPQCGHLQRPDQFLREGLPVGVGLGALPRDEGCGGDAECCWKICEYVSSQHGQGSKLLAL